MFDGTTELAPWEGLSSCLLGMGSTGALLAELFDLRKAWPPVKQPPGLPVMGRGLVLLPAFTSRWTLTDIAHLEAEIDRLALELHRRDLRLEALASGNRKALDLVREAGDCLLLRNHYACRMRIQEAALILHRVGEV